MIKECLQVIQNADNKVQNEYRFKERASQVLIMVLRICISKKTPEKDLSKMKKAGVEPFKMKLEREQTVGVTDCVLNFLRAVHSNRPTIQIMGIHMAMQFELNWRDIDGKDQVVLGLLNLMTNSASKVARRLILTQIPIMNSQILQIVSIRLRDSDKDVRLAAYKLIQRF
jgi:hypothetical protein